MKTVDFSKILVDAIQLCGLDRNEITDSTFGQLRDFASNRIIMDWEHDRWPDLIRYESVSVLVDGDVNYCLKPANAGEVIGIYDLNPVCKSRARNLNFLIQHTDTQERFVLNVAHPDGVWLEYRIQPITFNGDKWSPTVAYQVNSQTYFDSGSNSGTYQPVSGKPFRGNFYTCLTNNTNTNPSTSPNWSLVKIPYIFGQYIARGVFADYLRSESQFDSAQVAEAEAKHFLDVEIDKVIRQQGQVQKINFIQPY